MALSPLFWPSRLIDQNFGMCVTPNDLLSPFYNTYNNYYHPWKWIMPNVTNDIGSTITNEKESFKVTLDVEHFRPNELRVKVANSQIIVEGKHEERKDEHGFISRQFTRRYALPSNCMPEDVICNLSSDGVLTVIANKNTKELYKDEKSVKIKLCQSCPLKKEAIKTSCDQKGRSAEVKTDDASKKNKQIMLKEDHCCLLFKPELLGTAVSDCTELMLEMKKGKVEQEKVKACQVGKNTFDILEQTLAKTSATVLASGEKTDTLKIEERVEQSSAKAIPNLVASTEKTATGKTEKSAEQKVSESIMSLAASCEKTANLNIEELAERKEAQSIAILKASRDMCEKTTSTIEGLAEQKNLESVAIISSSASEKSDITTVSKSEELAKQSITKASATMTESEEKFDLFDEATSSMSTSEYLEQTFEKSNLGISSLSATIGLSSMSKSEISGHTSMSSKTSENIECATSSCVASNIIKEMNEEVSDFVSEILCFEEGLEKTQDIKK